MAFGVFPVFVGNAWLGPPIRSRRFSALYCDGGAGKTFLCFSRRLPERFIDDGRSLYDLVFPMELGRMRVYFLSLPRQLLLPQHRRL